MPLSSSPSCFHRAAQILQGPGIPDMRVHACTLFGSLPTFAHMMTKSQVRESTCHDQEIHGQTCGLTDTCEPYGVPRSRSRTLRLDLRNSVQVEFDELSVCRCHKGRMGSGMSSVTRSATQGATQQPSRTRSVPSPNCGLVFSSLDVNWACVSSFTAWQVDESHAYRCVLCDYTQSGDVFDHVEQVRAMSLHVHAQYLQSCASKMDMHGISVCIWCGSL